MLLRSVYLFEWFFTDESYSVCHEHQESPLLCRFTASILDGGDDWFQARLDVFGHHAFIAALDLVASLAHQLQKKVAWPLRAAPA